ncbi:MAG: sigma factor [Bacteroidota bacterium]
MIADPTFFQNELLGFVIKKVKDRSIAEDIVHDVFLKAQAKSSQVKDNDKMIGWIYRITRNTIIDHFRFNPESSNPKTWIGKTTNHISINVLKGV